MGRSRPDRFASSRPFVIVFMKSGRLVAVNSGTSVRRAQDALLETARKGPMKSKANVSDVARLAKVSAATVSRTFNTPDAVRDDVRTRVIEAAHALGYSANPAAKALRMRRSHIIGAVIPTLNYDIFAQMINAFQTRMTEAGYMVFLLTVGFDNRVVYGPVRQLVDRGAEGLLMVGRIEDPRLEAYLIDRRLPVVTTYSFQADSAIPSIGFDNYAASRQLIDYLIRLGHKHLVMLCGPSAGNDRQQARIKAFRDAAQAARQQKTAHVIECVYTIADGGRGMRKVHAEYPQATAVICNSDVLAFGALAECKRLGIRVPKDISIAGFDDNDWAAVMDPPLTTVAVPALDMGVRSAEALLHAVGSDRSIESVRLETNLVVRASTGPPKT